MICSIRDVVFGKIFTKKGKDVVGTRSITVVHDEDIGKLVAMYRQFDGYPEGHGRELLNFLSEFKIVNGIPLEAMLKGREMLKVANGMGCLAAQIVAHFKDEHGIGGIYLVPEQQDLIDYTYIISGKAHTPLIMLVYEWWKYNEENKPIFEGSLVEFAQYLEKLEAVNV